MRKCSRCEKTRRANSFGRHHWCLPCCREVQAERVKRNPEAERQRVKEAQKKAKERNRNFVDKVKDKPCVDCLKKFSSWIMQFDHRGESKKEADVSVLVHKGSSLKRVKREVLKCDVVCANCHADRTHRRRLE